MITAGQTAIKFHFEFYLAKHSELDNSHVLIDVVLVLFHVSAVLFCRPLSHCFPGNASIFSDNLPRDSPGFSTDTGIFNKKANFSALISCGFHFNCLRHNGCRIFFAKKFSSKEFVGKLALPPPPVISNRASLTDFVLVVRMLFRIRWF